ncbi:MULTISPECIES: phosphotransferase family protein [unclassified Pseudonocardia]|uniref:phosphotransferase family protein n=1 Tax=unclassified Pseudonocardia TaxID=2619320 RepID=UPI0001FFE732|nr:MULTISPECIES: phosphotransferase family protein [unclassified Pseudonocardia]ALE73896.1 aminoglycoside phosphotransferase [Pseudonocardia sp. EC080625-04]ALL77288.1 aminoglycoside phosphotransferase [Pseudonocardia sp. EC080610-09]ALL80204.1 aminoglycoside phosphotransferase [Pseudonocardia sp. EC080619-01]OLM18105.1 putative phosphotransferase [Pseudonocardia sp. Ae707_Ps1]
MTTSARTPTPGADPTAVGRWLATVLDDERWADSELAPIGAGRSNLTYRVSSPAGAVVLRRPPVGTVAATAHDMGREQRVIAALAPTAVPVPAVLATHDGGDGGPVDAPCFVMELVDGVVPLDELPEGWAATGAGRRAAGEALVDVLAELHAVDPATVGLEGFGRPDGFMERQIRRWSTQWATARDGDDPVPVSAEVESELTRLAGRLGEDVPAAQRHTIVHGDYRLDNCVFDAGDPGRILAVLDWEMSTLGDPLADLGLLLVYWQQDGDDAVWSSAQPLPSPTALPGFPRRDELVRAYAARTGLDVTPLPWYVAFGAFKLAVVLAGILARVRAGSVPADMAEGLDGSVGPLVALGHHVLDGGSF